MEHRTGDLFTADDVDALAHGCNCAGAMGRGIAVEFRRRWPDMYREYRARCLDGRLTEGGLFPWRAPDGLMVYNLGTQAHWRTPATLAAVTSAVGTMLEHAHQHGVRRIALPKIAAGHGGLAWPDVESAIDGITRPDGVRLIVYTLGES
ncbi:macro domain-containing protein [Streptomyces hainanensis]|uniref:Phosphatase n=1 Tax=Streptomyces hainanensis TaxID=402648 RepID=A0A4R4TJ46_9ACTN|nr:macro domain-containing protein [Streptomyces hainanensis]TDC77737.1 phosphatase [Streptomyces hainanensis]